MPGHFLAPIYIKSIKIEISFWPCNYHWAKRHSLWINPPIYTFDHSTTSSTYPPSNDKNGTSTATNLFSNHLSISPSISHWAVILYHIVFYYLLRPPGAHRQFTDIAPQNTTPRALYVQALCGLFSKYSSI